MGTVLMIQFYLYKCLSLPAGQFVPIDITIKTSLLYCLNKHGNFHYDDDKMF